MERCLWEFVLPSSELLDYAVLTLGAAELTGPENSIRCYRIFVIFVSLHRWGVDHTKRQTVETSQAASRHNATYEAACCIYKRFE